MTLPEVDGKRRRLRKGGFPTKTAGREALADVRHRMANGEQMGGSVTTAMHLGKWLRAKTAAGRSESTPAQYRLNVDNCLTPVLGHLRLADVRATHVDGPLAEMERDGRGLPTWHRVLAALSSALGTTERRRPVSVNVRLGRWTLAVTASGCSHATSELAKDSAERVATVIAANGM